MPEKPVTPSIADLKSSEKTPLPRYGKVSSLNQRALHNSPEDENDYGVVIGSVKESRLNTREKP